MLPGCCTHVLSVGTCRHGVQQQRCTWVATELGRWHPFNPTQCHKTSLNPTHPCTLPTHPTRALEASRAKVQEMVQQRRMTNLSAPDDGEGSGGEGKAGRSKKRKKGPAAAAGEDFYVDDAAPIERLPKKNVKVGEGGGALCGVDCWVGAFGMGARGVGVVRERYDLGEEERQGRVLLCARALKAVRGVRAQGMGGSSGGDDGSDVGGPQVAGRCQGHGASF